MLNFSHLVFLNITLFILLSIAILIFTRLFPNKKINFLVLTLLFSILPIVSIFREGSYESGDFTIHIYRSMTFYKALVDGSFIPSWAGNLNGTYGYPLFLFLNSLPYYLISLVHYFGFSFITSLKIFLALSYIFSGIFFFLWVKEELKNNIAAFTGSIFYLFSPYHLVDLHFRATVGETLFFTTFPLFMLSVKLFFKNPKISSILFLAFTLSLIILSHQGLFTLSLIVVVPYIFYLYRTIISKHKNIVIKLQFITLSFKLAMGITIGIILSSFSWLPHLILSKYTFAYVLKSITVTFPKLSDLVYSPWRFGFLFQGPKGELSYLIGYTQLLVALLIILFLFSHKIKLFKNSAILWVIILLTLIFLITPLSAFIWNFLPILNLTQFSTRLLLFVNFSIATLAGITTFYFKKKPFIIYLLIFLTILSTSMNWGQRRVIEAIGDQALYNNLPYSTSQGEALCCMGQPIWINNSDPWIKKIPQNPAEIIEGSGRIITINKSTTNHNFITSSENRIIVKDNTWYFPGWKTYVDGRFVPVNYLRKDAKGIITIDVPRGLHEINVIYSDATLLAVAKLISLSLFIIISLFFVKSLIQKKIFNRLNDKINLFIRHFRKKG